MATFNGHKNWNHWNVSLWINNQEELYMTARDYVRKWGRAAAAVQLMNDFEEQGMTHTPDGAPYSVSSIRAAMRGM